MNFEKFGGSRVASVVEGLARLRISIFREYPYLYEGDLAYEKKYLQTYVNSPRSLVVMAKTPDGTAIGATTCLPLSDEEVKLQGNFSEKGYRVSDIFYFGESIVLPEYRGHGLGRKFFEYREEHARSYGTFRYTSFCAVVRPDNHPRKSPTYRSPENLWQRMGYKKLEGVTTHYAWKDLGHDHETEKLMQFWIKSIA